MNGTYDAACGFIMQGADETVNCNFYSTEYSSSASWPYLVLTYNAGEDDGCSGDISDPHTHAYTLFDDRLDKVHPHEVRYTCECGATRVSYQLRIDRTTCRANEKCAENTNCVMKVFVSADGDDNIRVPSLCC